MSKLDSGVWANVIWLILCVWVFNSYQPLLRVFIQNEILVGSLAMAITLITLRLEDIQGLLARTAVKVKVRVSK